MIDIFRFTEIAEAAQKILNPLADDKVDLLGSEPQSFGVSDRVTFHAGDGGQHTAAPGTSWPGSRPTPTIPWRRSGGHVAEKPAGLPPRRTLHRVGRVRRARRGLAEANDHS